LFPKAWSLKNIANVNEQIHNNIIDKKYDQQQLDNFLLNDSTENKSQFGANTFWEFL